MSETKWIPDGWGLESNDDSGGDTQVTNGYSFRYLLADENGNVVPRRVDGEDLYSFIEVVFYGETKMEGFYEDDGLARDSEGEPIIWVAAQTEIMVCADTGQTERLDLSSLPTDWEERWSNIEYEKSTTDYRTKDDAERYAKRMAEQYFNDPAMFARHFVWDGLAPWERV